MHVYMSVCLPACLPACLYVYYVHPFVQEWTFTTFVSETTVLCEVPEGRISYTVGLGGASTTLMYTSIYSSVIYLQHIPFFCIDTSHICAKLSGSTEVYIDR
jgi:hypothetical protein